MDQTVADHIKDPADFSTGIDPFRVCHGGSVTAIGTVMTYATVTINTIERWVCETKVKQRIVVTINVTNRLCHHLCLCTLLLLDIYRDWTVSRFANSLLRRLWDLDDADTIVYHRVGLDVLLSTCNG